MITSPMLRCWFLLFAIPSASAASLVVTTVGDSGPGSLRDAILEANQTPAHDVIEFNLPGDGPFTISPLSPLPRITAPLTIDGATQPGFAGQPVIELEGSGAGNANGLHIAAPNCTVRGLVINRFGGAAGNAAAIFIDSRGTNVIEGNFIGTDITGTGTFGSRQNGILISNSAGNRIGGTNAAARNVISGNGLNGVSIFFNSVRNTIQGNLIGTDVTGAAPLGNGGNGITISAANCVIGGATPGARNVISANTGAGIQVMASGCVIQGNLIGTDAAGTGALGNSMEGIVIENGSTNVIGGELAGAGNVISANRSSGIAIRSNASGTQVQGNSIGTDIQGLKALRNLRNGILIASRNNVIGGTNLAARNLISGNAPSGVAIVGAAGSRNQVLGNWIGIDATGAAKLANLENGILLNDAPGNIIGTPGGGNVISGNSFAGIEISGDTARTNVIHANRIGTDPAGANNLGNAGHGIFVNNNASGNVIGGTGANEGNLIAHNGGDGVYIETGSGNAARGNTIFSNVGLSVDLAPNGPTANDPADSDAGANALQNFPALSVANSSGGKWTVEGSLHTAPGATILVDFYGGAVCDPAHRAQANVYLSTLSVTADASGQAALRATFAAPAAFLGFVSAAATDANGNTSELSPCLAISSGPPRSSPPVLAATKIREGTVALTWPDSSLVLEMTESLTAPIRWSVVTNTPSKTPAGFSVEISASPGARFFRTRPR